MKALILAAGISSRLRPYTNEIPKTLLLVNNKTILSYTLDSLEQNDVNDIIICVGYRSSQIIEYCKLNHTHLNFTFVINENYENTNNMYSLYLAKDHFNDDFLIFNGDSIHEPEIINRMVKQENTCMAFDSKSYDEESMKIIVDKGKIIKMSKKIPIEKSYGSDVDIFKITKSDMKFVKNELIKIIETEKKLNDWIEVMLERLFKNEIIPSNLIDVSGFDWYEIDTYQDLLNARKIFSKNKLK